MEILFLVCLSTLPLVGSLLLATRIWGKQAVIRWCSETAWAVGEFAAEFWRRVLECVRALVGAHINAADATESIAEEVEERLGHKLESKTAVFNYRLHEIERRLERVEIQARMVLPVTGETDDE